MPAHSKGGGCTLPPPPQPNPTVVITDISRGVFEERLRFCTICLFICCYFCPLF